jgi:polyhydroxybutyrate depolymerase
MPNDERISIDVAGRARQFLLHLPDGRSAGLPLVVMLHGTGGTAAWAADETGWSDWADREGFAVAYPEGLPPDPGKPAKFLTNPSFWRDGSPRAADDRQTDKRFLAALLDWMIAHRGIDARRVFVTGFSNGASMAFALAATLAERIAAVAPVAGLCWLEKPRPARPVPTFYLIGSHDPLAPLPGGRVKLPWGPAQVKPSVFETLAKWARAIDCAPTPITLAEDRGLLLETYLAADGDDRRFRSLIICELGHHWPGGKGKLSQKIGGPFISTFSACERIWEFFRSQV